MSPFAATWGKAPKPSIAPSSSSGRNSAFVTSTSRFTSNRMLKKSLFSPARPRRLLHPPALSLPRQPLYPGTRLFPCSVLASFRPSTFRRSFSEVRSPVGAFPFAKTHCKGERPTRSAVCTSLAPHSLRPCLRNGASWRAGGGRVGEKSGLFEHPVGVFSHCTARLISSQAHVRPSKL